MFMALEAALIFDRWGDLPGEFWAVVFFTVGCCIGSFLNVCIHRLPLGQSIVSPPSHCPHCQYAIPGYLNIPLLTWLMLRGRCRNCGAGISIRYFLVELLTGGAFLAAWLRFGEPSPGMPVVYALLLAGLITASFIDLEHYIIPDEITKGGIVAGLFCSFLLPALHGQTAAAGGLILSAVGAAAGAGVIYAVVRLGKLLFGRQRVKLPPDARVLFTEDGLVLPDGPLPFEEIFYRQSDTVVVDARRVEMVDRCYTDVVVRLSPQRLRVGEDEFDPATVPHLEAVAERLVLPREAMGLGDVKFMAAIGAFLGWQAIVFTLFASAVLGAVGGSLTLLARRGGGSRVIPYGPYIALAAVLWMFYGPELLTWWLRFMGRG
jgi:leader peptidase (prepilin peptidase)/N-methyltransferase